MRYPDGSEASTVLNEELTAKVKDSLAAVFSDLSEQAPDPTSTPCVVDIVQTRQTTKLRFNSLHVALEVAGTIGNRGNPKMFRFAATVWPQTGEVEIVDVR